MITVVPPVEQPAREHRQRPHRSGLKSDRTKNGEKMQTKLERWEGFGKALDLYYTNPEKHGTVPTQSYHLEANGITYHNFGRNIQRYILEGLPKNCPNDIREKMEKYKLLTKDTKDTKAIITVNTGTTPGRVQRWKEFGEALDLYYTNPENHGTVPTRQYHLKANGTTYRNFGRNIQRYILEGPTKDCPNYIREKMEKYKLPTKETKAILAARTPAHPKRRPQASRTEHWKEFGKALDLAARHSKKNPRTHSHEGTLIQFSHSGDVQTDTFEVSLSAADMQMLQDLGKTVNAGLSQSEVTASH
ncbi:hypothetical protein ACFC09_31390, partial [Streptomyces sp. NPDC056161]|uniref:hypothetical protein n=1 Tax=Streptomyces sp. NPDC056161 TaxID=3345732 RepID=UPI0035DD81E9